MNVILILENLFNKENNQITFQNLEVVLFFKITIIKEIIQIINYYLILHKYLKK